ncbi:hypothetical protein [Actinoplanes sp. NPDC051494]|uniref:hypothetical protein n=1 Tax=Actinoplanes sp. NPDC051494 TaxID=3363907 RepID=UPI0037950ACF
MRLSVPAQCAGLLRSSIIGPTGDPLSEVGAGAKGRVDVGARAGGQVAVVLLDRDDPAFHMTPHLARPWRAEAKRGDIYRSRPVDDPRSADRSGLPGL